MKLFMLILTEGILLTLIGTVFGFVAAHAGFVWMGTLVKGFQGDGLFFVNDEYYVLAGSFAVGIFAAIIPAVMAYRSGISETLSKG